MANAGEEDQMPSDEEEESDINDQATDEESTVVRKVITTSKTVKEDYDRMVKILLKQTGLNTKDIEGMSSKEAFDKLSFLADHVSLESPKKRKNEPVVPISPSGIGIDKVEGVKITTNPNTGRKTYVIDPEHVFKNKK